MLRVISYRRNSEKPKFRKIVALDTRRYRECDFPTPKSVRFHAEGMGVAPRALDS
jgi:hypothetical protein